MRTTTDICPECGRPVPADSRTLGLCPRCLIRGVLGGGGESGRSSGRLDSGYATSGPSGRPGASRRTGSFVEPTVAELALRLPSLRVVRLIGRGGMGAVYEAVQPALDRTVAVKVVPLDAIDADFVDREAAAERFKLEARVLARLNHPNVVAVHDTGRVDALAYFVMEHVAGESLRHALAAGPLPAHEAFDIARQVCDALGYAHRRRVVHRDVKPENILLVRSDDGRLVAKVADFGLAKLTHADAVDPLTGLAVQSAWAEGVRVPPPAWQRVVVDPVPPADDGDDLFGFAEPYALSAPQPDAASRSGGRPRTSRRSSIRTPRPMEGLLSAPAARMGTPAYAAPEQSAGRAVDARADLYALGVVLYEMLTGHRPPPATVPAAGVAAGDRSAVGDGPPPPTSRMPSPPPPRLAARLDDAVLRCLAVDPADRFPSAEDLRRALDAADLALADSARPAVKAFRRTAVLVGAAGAFALVLLPAAFTVGRQGWSPWPRSTATTGAVRPPPPNIAPSPNGPSPVVTPPALRPPSSPVTPPTTGPAGDAVFSRFAARVGRERVLTVRVHGAPDEYRNFVIGDVTRAAGVGADAANVRGDPLVVYAAPSTETSVVARSLRLGQVTSADPASNTIVVRADLSLFPKSLGPSIDDPRDPRFADQAVTELTGWDLGRRRSATYKIRRADPSKVSPERRAAAVVALRAMVTANDMIGAQNAIEALGTWGSTDDVPLLERVLASRDWAYRRNTVEALGRIGGPRATELLIDRLGTTFDATEASRALAVLGLAAEPALLARLADPKTEPPIRAGIVQHLGNAGTPACVGAVAGAQSDPDGAIRAAAGRALSALRNRFPDRNF